MQRVSIMLLLALAATGCDRPKAAEPKPAPRMPGMNDQDAFTRRVVTAMCGQPAERALAISALAEPSKDGDESQDVYDVASDVAKQGCPTKAAGSPAARP